MSIGTVFYERRDIDLEENKTVKQRKNRTRDEKHITKSNFETKETNKQSHGLFFINSTVVAQNSP